jgi:YHS domain-containing protein
MLMDPVCGKRIKRQRAHIAIDFEGTTYYLCCPRCQADFEREPKKFARPEIGEKTNASHGRHANSQPRIARGLAQRVVRGPAA